MSADLCSENSVFVRIVELTNSIIVFGALVQYIRQCLSYF